MLDDLRAMLRRMENPPKYWAIAMAVIIAALWLAGVTLLTIAEIRRGTPDKSLPLAAIVLTVLAAMSYSPFANRCASETWEARRLREALYPQRLEGLAYYMAVLRIGGHDDVADRLTAIWQRHGLEPGWMARRHLAPPQFH